MRLKRYTANWPNYYAAKKFFDEKQKRSRTYVNKLKAVRLPRPVNNTVLYQDGEDMVFRLYNTDIVRYRPDESAEIQSGNYYTPTTFQRIYDIAGVNIGSFRGSTNKSVYRSRVAIQDAYKDDIPYFDGLKFNTTTAGILNVEDIPSDLSKSKQRPTKEAQKQFRALWKELHPRIMLGINLGVWADEILERDGSVNSWYTPARPPIAIAKVGKFLCNAVNTGKTLTDLELQSVVLTIRPKNSFPSRDANKITDQLKQEIPTIRSKLQFGFAKEIGELEDVGGALIGGTYHLNPKDEA